MEVKDNLELIEGSEWKYIRFWGHGIIDGLKSWELKKGDAVATLFEQEHKGNGQMVFTS